MHCRLPHTLQAFGIINNCMSSFEAMCVISDEVISHPRF